MALAVAVFLALISVRSNPSHATGFTDIGQDIRAETDVTVTVHGYLRTRAELFYNLDLDRGPTTSGLPLFPVPLSDPTGQTLTNADLTVRTDLAFIAPQVGIAVKLRVDLLNNLSMGSLPEGVPSVTVRQRAPESAMLIRRAYGEWLSPFGLLVAGRTGSDWGLGILTNSGDCADCNLGDVADRFALIVPTLGHIWAFAYDLSSTGPFLPRRAPNRAIDFDRLDDVSSVTFALLNFRDESSRLRRQRAQRTTFEYGFYVSHRWQKRDVPASYLPTANPVPITPAQSVYRGFRATAVDTWFRLTLPRARIEAEAAVLFGAVDQPSLIPGVLMADSVESTQWGAAIESDWGLPEDAFGIGLDAGIASGDPAYGFGVVADPLAPPPQPGDLDGPQAEVPVDTRVDNFRFHPDYFIDRILFREIIGTVTDAIYLRPHARWTVAAVGPGRLTLGLALIASWAVEPRSTPSGERALGVELDPTLAYEIPEGLIVALEYGALFPLAGLDNPEANLTAQPAQLLRLRLQFLF